MSVCILSIRNTIRHIIQDYSVVRSPDLTAVTAYDLLMPFLDIPDTPDIRFSS